MSTGNVVPMFPPRRPLRERLAARRAYRERMKQVAAAYVAEAFNSSGKGLNIGCEEALPLFMAAMRREILKPWRRA